MKRAAGKLTPTPGTALTADTALRLERVLGIEVRFWTNLQATYDLRVAELENGPEYLALKSLVGQK